MNTFKAWTKKNANALHVIQLSFGPRVCCALRMITSAKIAWDTLTAICSLPISDYEPGISHSLKCTSTTLKHFKRKIGLQSARYESIPIRECKKKSILPIQNANFSILFIHFYKHLTSHSLFYKTSY